LEEFMDLMLHNQHEADFPNDAAIYTEQRISYSQQVVDLTQEALRSHGLVNCEVPEPTDHDETSEVDSVISEKSSYRTSSSHRQNRRRDVTVKEAAIVVKQVFEIPEPKTPVSAASGHRLDPKKSDFQGSSVLPWSAKVLQSAATAQRVVEGGSWSDFQTHDDSNNIGSSLSHARPISAGPVLVAPALPCRRFGTRRKGAAYRRSVAVTGDSPAKYTTTSMGERY
jgi:hypothetical protein